MRKCEKGILKWEENRGEEQTSTERCKTEGKESEYKAGETFLSLNTPAEMLLRWSNGERKEVRGRAWEEERERKIQSAEERDSGAAERKEKEKEELRGTVNGGSHQITTARGVTARTKIWLLQDIIVPPRLFSCPSLFLKKNLSGFISSQRSQYIPVTAAETLSSAERHSADVSDSDDHLRDLYSRETETLFKSVLQKVYSCVCVLFACIWQLKKPNSVCTPVHTHTQARTHAHTFTYTQSGLKFKL